MHAYELTLIANLMLLTSVDSSQELLQANSHFLGETISFDFLKLHFASGSCAVNVLDDEILRLDYF